MKNASSRLTRLEQKVGDSDGIGSWDWANHPYYLSLPEAEQEAMANIMEKLRPHLPNDPKAAMDTLTLEELEALELFYLAYFGEVTD